MTAEELHASARGGRKMTWQDRDFEFPEQPVASLSDIDEFLEDGGERWRESFSSEEGREMEVLEGDEEREESRNNVEESKKFWETQHQLLQVIYSGRVFSCSTNKYRMLSVVHV